MNDQCQTLDRQQIPERLISQWQKIIDVMSQTMNVPAVLITRISASKVEVFLSSSSTGNPYQKGMLLDEHFSEQVINERVPLKIPDSTKDPFLKKNHDIAFGMKYFSGLPLICRDGGCFGCICIHDSQANSPADSYEQLFHHFKNTIEEDLCLLFDQLYDPPPALSQKNQTPIKNKEKTGDVSKNKNEQDGTTTPDSYNISQKLKHGDEISLNRMLDAFPGGYIITSYTNEIIEANQIAQEWLHLQFDKNGKFYLVNPQKEAIIPDGKNLTLEDLILPKSKNAPPMHYKEIGIRKTYSDTVWLNINEIRLPENIDRYDIRILTLMDITDRIRTEAALREREDQLRLKLDSILSPDVEISEEEMINVFDIKDIESMFQDFSDLTGYLTAIIDVKGKILVATGWSEMCTQFHRIHPVMSLRCLESDTELARKTRPGEYTEHRCINHLRSVATPLMIAGKHVADVYTGQFFYDDETKPVELFEKQAEEYGFNKEAYLAALDKIPHVSRKSMKLVMDFLTKFAGLISRLGYSNLKLAKAMSEQKRIEEALRNSESHFRQLTSQAPIPIAISNERDELVYFNEKFISTFGYTLEDIPDVESWWLKAFPDEEYRQAVKKKWHDALDNKQTGAVEIVPNEFLIAGKDGTVHFVEIFASRIGGKLLTMINDITERKHIEEMMIQREKLVGIGTLAAGITHEMNSPLQVITGVSESSIRLLETDTLEKEELLKRLNQISKNAWRLARIVRSLLDYARSVPGDNAIPCSMNQLVEQTLTLTEHQFKSWSNITITSQLENNLPLTVLDANQMTQVIINLLTNARDAMPNGGEITINTSYDSESDTIVLRVKDTGYGIPEEIHTKIFDPFFTTKPVGEGTGLGLSIIAGIIHGYKGEIELESSSKMGTVFKISLPIVHTMPSNPENGYHGRY